MTSAGHTWRSKQVAIHCGVSLRELQWWDQQGLVSPMQVKHARAYRAEDVIAVALVAALRRKGILSRYIRVILRTVQKHVAPQTLQGGIAGYLLTDYKARKVLVLENETEVTRRLVVSLEPLLAVSLAECAAKASGTPPVNRRETTGHRVLKAS